MKMMIVSVIEWLRREYPGKWTYHEHRWEHEDGTFVVACSALAPRHDGDDDHFETQYYLYEKGKTPTRIWLFRAGLWLD